MFHYSLSTAELLARDQEETFTFISEKDTLQQFWEGGTERGRRDRDRDRETERRETETETETERQRDRERKREIMHV